METVSFVSILTRCCVCSASVVCYGGSKDGMAEGRLASCCPVHRGRERGHAGVERLQKGSKCERHSQPKGHYHQEGGKDALATSPKKGHLNE